MAYMHVHVQVHEGRRKCLPLFLSFFFFFFVSSSFHTLPLSLSHSLPPTLPPTLPPSSPLSLHSQRERQEKGADASRHPHWQVDGISRSVTASLPWLTDASLLWRSVRMSFLSLSTCTYSLMHSMDLWTRLHWCDGWWRCSGRPSKRRNPLACEGGGDWEAALIANGRGIRGNQRWYPMGREWEVGDILSPGCNCVCISCVCMVVTFTWVSPCTYVHTYRYTCIPVVYFLSHLSVCCVCVTACGFVSQAAMVGKRKRRGRRRESSERD